MMRPQAFNDPIWDDGDQGAPAASPEVDFDPARPQVLLGPDGDVLLRIWPTIGFQRR